MIPKTDLRSISKPSPAITLGRIQYMNVAPVYHGLDNGLKPDWVRIVDGTPSMLNRRMSRGELDISPVSSAAYAAEPGKWVLLPDLSIACHGPVMSVLLASKHPMEALDGKRVMITDESATAAALLKLILHEKGIRPNYEVRSIDADCKSISQADAALVIGDTALKGTWDDCFGYVWDMGEVWHSLKGLPFVFAVWAVRRSLAQNHPDLVTQISDLFRQSQEEALRCRTQIISMASRRLGLDICRVKAYYQHLHYGLEENVIKGLETFFKGLNDAGIIPAPAKLEFFRAPASTSRRHCAA
jgi:chorismate dehydratase